MIGGGAGRSITSSDNICIGDNSNVGAGFFNSIAIGASAFASQSNTIVIGNSQSTNSLLGGTLHMFNTDTSMSCNAGNGANTVGIPAIAARMLNVLVNGVAYRLPLYFP